MARRWRVWLALGVLAGCGERDRPTFPVENPGDGSGPVTSITRPLAPDTAVVEGDLLIVTGYSVDPDGIDTVYLEVSGAGLSFPPIIGEGLDSVPFALQLSTFGNSGGNILVRAYAVDGVGDRGSASDRSITIEQCGCAGWQRADFGIPTTWNASRPDPPGNDARQVFITAPRRDELPPEADLPVWNLDAGRVSR